VERSGEARCLVVSSEWSWQVENGERYPVQSAFNFPVVPASEIRMKPVGVLIC